MKKKIIKRALSGFPQGIAIGLICTIISSIFVGDGCFYFTVPELVTSMGNELNAAILQTFICGAIGSGFSIASIIWEFDSWSLAKQSCVYFAVISAIMLPISYFMRWMQHSLWGVLSYVFIFTVIAVIIWILEYFFWKIKIKKMNEKMKNNSYQN